VLCPPGPREIASLDYYRQVAKLTLGINGSTTRQLTRMFNCDIYMSGQGADGLPPPPFSPVGSGSESETDALYAIVVGDLRGQVEAAAEELSTIMFDAVAEVKDRGARNESNQSQKGRIRAPKPKTVYNGRHGSDQDREGRKRSVPAPKPEEEQEEWKPPSLSDFFWDASGVLAVDIYSPLPLQETIDCVIGEDHAIKRYICLRTECYLKVSSGGVNSMDEGGDDAGPVLVTVFSRRGRSQLEEALKYIFKLFKAKMRPDAPDSPRSSSKPNLVLS